jgi:hypothetical protein
LRDASGTDIAGRDAKDAKDAEVGAAMNAIGSSRLTPNNTLVRICDAAAAAVAQIQACAGELQQGGFVVACFAWRHSGRSVLADQCWLTAL